MPWFGIYDNFGSPNLDTDLSHGHLGARYTQINLNGDAVAAGDGIRTVLRTSGDFLTSCAYAEGMSPGYSTWAGFSDVYGGVLATHDCDGVILGGDGILLGRWTESVHLSLDMWLPASSAQADRTIGTGTVSMGIGSGLAGVAVTSAVTPPFLMVLMNRTSNSRVSFFLVRVTSFGDPPTVELLDSSVSVTDYEDGGTMDVYFAMGRIHIKYPSVSSITTVVFENFESPDFTAYSVIIPGIYCEQGSANGIYVDNFQVCSAIYDEMGPVFPSKRSSYVALVPSSTANGTEMRVLGCSPIYGQIAVYNNSISSRGVTYPDGYVYAHSINPVPYASSNSFSVQAKITLNVSNSTNAIGLSALGHLAISATDVLAFYPVELQFFYSGSNITCQLCVREHDDLTAPSAATVLASKTDIDPGDWTAVNTARFGIVSWDVSYVDGDIVSVVELPGDVTWSVTEEAPAFYESGPYAGFFVEGAASVANDIYLAFVDAQDDPVYGYGPAEVNVPDTPSISTPTLAPVRFTGSTFSDDDDGDYLTYSEWQLTSYSDTTYELLLQRVYMDYSGAGYPYADFTLISGSQYRARVRYYDSYGEVSVWSDDITFTATFSSGAIELTDLPLWPSGLPNPMDSSTETIEFKTSITQFESSGIESRQKIRPTGTVLWHLVFKTLTMTQYDILKTFFVDRCGSWGAFYFADPLDPSQVYRMRFASDKLTRDIYSSVLNNVEIDLVQLSEYSQQV
jgi:hypothetical protein